MKPLKRALAYAAFVLCTCWSALAFAHKPSDSYLTLTVDGSHVHVRWDIAIRDLATVVDLDADGDGKITWREVEANRAAIEAYALAHLGIGDSRGDCELAVSTKKSDYQVVAHSDGNYVVLAFETTCPETPAEIAVRYRAFFQIDAQHRGLVRFDWGEVETHVVTARESTATFRPGETHRGRRLGNIIAQGILHIWTGYDHILFLIALLLPAVLRREAGRWEPVPSLKTALLDVLRIVTAFTIAHSITLSLAALDIVTLPSRLIESAIAASVVLAAMNNLRPILKEDRWVAAFLLGLMHGFGFSSALQDLDLPRSNLVLMLFGFNLGVEIGQVAIVAAFVPAAYAVRRSSAYRRWVLAGGSVVILLLATVWLVERAFDVKLIS